MKKTVSLILTASIAASVSVSGCETKSGNQLIMATNATFPPYEYLDENGDLIGIDIEIGRAIAEKLGKELVIRDVKFDDVIDGVEDNSFDFGMAALTVSEDRKAKVSFSDTYAKGIQVVIVKADSEYSSFKEFYNGFDSDGIPTGVKGEIKIGVQKETTGDSYSSDTLINWGFGKENVKRFDSGEAAVEALLSDDVTAVIIDDEPAKAFLKSHEGLKILDGAYADEDYAVIVSKEDNELLGRINNAIKELRESGILDKIIGKYIQ
ncbi:MAG TPA: ABC transporter substrate-binding protein [Ruminococcaceae bacterium]|nr:ABC transporter substrate-binding protein [Oscillospiraceae bacterium]